MGNGGGEAAPVGGLFFQMLAPESGERIKLRAAVVLCLLPLGGDPAFLFELVQSRIEGSFADLQDVSGDGFEAEADGPAVQGLKSEYLKEKKVESALDQVRWLAHVLSSVTEGYDT
jgi:hypothetical protein